MAITFTDSGRPVLKEMKTALTSPAPKAVFSRSTFVPGCQQFLLRLIATEYNQQTQINWRRI